MPTSEVPRRAGAPDPPAAQPTGTPHPPTADVVLAVSDPGTAGTAGAVTNQPGTNQPGTPALLEAIQAHAPFGLGFMDRAGRVVHINETLAEAWGSTVAALTGRRLDEVLPDRWAQVEAVLRRVLAGEAVHSTVVTTPADGPDNPSDPNPGDPGEPGNPNPGGPDGPDGPDGPGGPDDPAPSREWLTNYHPVVVGGELIGVGTMAIDITERARAEDARRRLSAIVDHSGDAIFSAGLDGIISTWNAAAEQLFGYPADEIIGQPITVLCPPGRVDEQAAVRERLAAGGPPECYETMRRRRDGSRVDVRITASSTTDGSGRPAGFSIIAHDITDQRRAQEALERSREQLAQAQRLAGLGSFEIDVASGEVSGSDELRRILGLPPGRRLTVAGLLELVPEEDRPALDQAWRDSAGRVIAAESSVRIIRPDGARRHVRARLQPEVGPEDTVVRITGTLVDETERVETERVRRAAEARFEIGFEQSAVGAAIVGLDALPLRVNPALCRLLGRPEEELVGRRWSAYTHPDELPLSVVVGARVAEGHDTFASERRYLRPDGTVVWASCHITLVRDADGEPWYVFAQFQDVTERKRMEQELTHRALHDSLTGLPNRALLNDRLHHALAGSARRGSTLGVLFLDLDRFRVVNDSLGHGCGDDLLRLVAERVAGAIRPGDTVARFGGDELVIVCEGVSAREAERVAERVLSALAEPFRIGEHEVTVTASIGVALTDGSGTPEGLLRDADTAVHRAKERGRGRVELFDETLRDKAERRLATASALHRALDRRELQLHYQPVVDVATGELVGAEALLRWEHPERGMVGPDEFIPVAEDTGLIVPIGAWVLEEACRQLADWQRRRPTMTVAVNLSARQMAPGLADVVAGVLERTGVAPGDLVLEVTESVLMDDVDHAAATLERLRALGVPLALDDFGTGYSSLSYLKRFPVDSVKIDRSFVDGLGDDPHDEALVAAIVAMAGALGLDVIAEGVETAGQLVHLHRLGCDQAQGYHLARPMPAGALTPLVAEGHRWPAPGPAADPS